MAKKKNKNNNNELFIYIFWFILGVFFGMLLLFIINNYDGQTAYEFISCDYNNKTCSDITYGCDCGEGDCPDSAGNPDFECTSLIIAECCDETTPDTTPDPDNLCEGRVAKASDCDEKECTSPDAYCDSYDNFDGTYTCFCTLGNN